MNPLLSRDGLAMPTITLVTFFLVGCNNTGFLAPVQFIPVNRSPLNKSKRVYPIEKPEPLNQVLLWLFALSIVGCYILAFSSVYVKPPSRYPDLWPVLVSIYSCGHFVIFALFFHYVQLLENDNRKKKEL
jgi:alpha-1,3-glucosyltransferase